MEQRSHLSFYASEAAQILAYVTIITQREMVHHLFYPDRNPLKNVAYMLLDFGTIASSLFRQKNDQQNI